jgi:hypothetical protein
MSGRPLWSIVASERASAGPPSRYGATTSASPAEPKLTVLERAEAGGSAWESNPARPRERGQRPVLKTGRATGPRSLPTHVLYLPQEKRRQDFRRRSVRTGRSPRGDGRVIGRIPVGRGVFAPPLGCARTAPQPSISLTSPARGPLPDSSGVNSTR